MKVDYESRFRLYENGTVTITSGRCPYSDEHREKVKQNGKRVKTYKIDTRIYRKIVSSAVNLYRHKVNKIIFLTLTFPGYIGEKDANICFSKFMDNLKTNYNVENYIAVKEFTKAGIPHYHIIADYPYFDIRRINRAWCNTFPITIPGSQNAVRLPKNHRSVVKDLYRTIKYICKYFSKSRDVEYKSRCFFISHDILSAPVDIDYELAEKLINKYSSFQFNYHYCSILILNDCFQDYSLIDFLLSGNTDLTQFT